MLNHLTRVTEEVDAGHQRVTEYAYDPNRNRVLVRSGEAVNGRQPANAVQTLHDERDRVFRVVRAPGDPLQSTTQHDYDGNGNLVAVQQGLESAPRTTVMVYDGYDRVIDTTDATGNRTRLSYDANGNIVRSRTDGELRDVAGSAGNVRLRELRFTFDAMNRPIRTDTEFFDTATQAPIRDGRSSLVAEFSPNSQITRLVDDNGHAKTIQYDTVYRRRVVTDAKGNGTQFAYDATSNIRSIIETEKSDLSGPDDTFITTFQYDNLNRLVKRTDSGGNVNDYRYDSRGNLGRIVDALRLATNQPGNSVYYVHDGLNRLIETTQFLSTDGTGAGADAGSIVTRQAWDDSSRLIRQIDANGNATVYSYDPLDRLARAAYADGSGDSYGYDAQDNPVTMTDANETVVTSTYDLLNRRIRSDVAPGPGVSSDTTFEITEYDGLSRLVTARDNDSQLEFAYDSLSQRIRETLNGKSTTASFDGDGNMLSCAYPGGRVVTWTYDELDRKKTATDPLGVIAGYEYAGRWRVGRRTYGNNTRTTYAYDSARRPRQTTHLQPLTALVFDDREYAWDSMHNKTLHRDRLPGGVRQDFGYDSVHRLVRSERSVPGGGAETVAYEFDGVGNRLRVLGGPDPGSYSLNRTLPVPGDGPVNQYSTSPFDQRTYDSRGNLTAINAGLPGQRSLVYDFRNRLVAHTDTASGLVTTYAYDALGRRIQKSIRTAAATQETRYFYSGWQLCEEQNADGVTLASFVYGRSLDEVLNMRRGVENFYYHADDLHSVRKITDAAGRVVEAYEYRDYGEPLLFNAAGTPLAQSAIGNPFLFTGQAYDSETGFFQYRTRYLDPLTGRFLTRDLLGLWGASENLGNPYAYVGNNPGSATDPYGMDRELMRGGHAFIRVDTYDKNGKKNGQMSLHFAPEIAFGNSTSDWNMNLPRQDVWYNDNLAVSTKIASTRAEDEALLAFWRNQKRLGANAPRWNPLQNCYWAALKYYDYGMPSNPAPAPRGPTIGPEPDQGIIENTRRAINDGLKTMEEGAQKVIDFFDNPAPALTSVANSFMSLFSSSPTPPPVPPRPASNSGADIAPVTASSRTR